MATKKQSVLIYQMKAALTDIEPPIWRRFLVVSDITLYKLHLILQTVFGWENYHLYEFTIDNEFYGEPDDEYEQDINRASRFTLNQVIHTEKQEFLYIYDYGDNWEHRIVVEKILPVEQNAIYPFCLAGERACPPEDCGGVTGYMDMLEIISDPEHEEYKHITAWLGGSFDPERFDLISINKELVRHRHEWRSMALPGMDSPQMTIRPAIDRSIAIIKFKLPFLEWLNSVSDDSMNITMDVLNSDCAIFLIPEFDSKEEAIRFIEGFYREVFEMELDSWHRDRSVWPKRRSLKLFREWFGIEIHSMVMDALDEEIEKEW